MCPDEWMHALDIDLWDQPARGRIEQLQWSQTTRLLALGVTVIIEWGLWTRGERDVLREQVHALGGADRAALPRRARGRAVAAPRRPQPATGGGVDGDRPGLAGGVGGVFEAPTAEELAHYDVPVA